MGDGRTELGLGEELVDREFDAGAFLKHENEEGFGEHLDAGVLGGIFLFQEEKELRDGVNKSEGPQDDRVLDCSGGGLSEIEGDLMVPKKGSEGADQV